MLHCTLAACSFLFSPHIIYLSEFYKEYCAQCIVQVHELFFCILFIYGLNPFVHIYYQNVYFVEWDRRVNFLMKSMHVSLLFMMKNYYAEL